MRIAHPELLAPVHDAQSRADDARPPVDPLEPTIFHERWWLDIASAGRVRFADATQNGKVVGRLPYLLRRKYGVAIGDMPPLTHFLGPAVLDGQGKGCNRFLRRLDIARDLIGQLPPTASFHIKCHRDVADVIAFQACGFRSSVQFTHEIHPQPIGDVWTGMRDKGRNGIRLAQTALAIDHDLSDSDYLAFYAANVDARGRRNHIDMATVRALISAARSRGRGSLIAARDPLGALAAAIFCIWDRRSYYYLMSTRSAAAHRGATSLLLWEAIGDAMRRGLMFDFDGAPNEGSARLAANFTPTLAPRYVVTRESKPMRVVRALQALRREPNFF